MSSKKYYVWEHAQVGDNSGHFAILKHFISSTFSFWRALETGAIKVMAECITECEDETGYLITCTGAGNDPASWTGEIMVSDENKVLAYYNEDTHEITPDQLRNIILFQTLYGTTD